ncbi:MAG TPA: methyltransferase domain-containing protein [Chloroflexota bacterium]|nr:methyltransferase domain-containing protein [Chloroflexota bacterium]
MRAQESYDRVAAAYARRFVGELEHKPLDRQLLQRFAREINATSERPACDLGCGPGHIARYLHDLTVPVVGVDISAGMIAEASRLNPEIEFRQGDMMSLDLEDGSLSGVAAFYSILHVPRAEVTAALREIRRVLAPAGLLLLSFHIGSEVRHIEEFFDEPVHLDFVFFEVPEMEGYLRDAGFADIESIERDPYPDVEVQTRRAYIFARCQLPRAVSQGKRAGAAGSRTVLLPRSSG